MNYNIWYISKYAVTPKYGFETRQFIFSKYFAKQGHNVSLISSRSSSLKNRPDFKSLYIKDEIDGVTCYMLNGISIKLGFNLKRIFSWMQFEIQLRRWARKNKKKPDVIIISSLSLLTILNGIFFKRKYKAKLVFEVRDIWPLTLLEVGNFSKINPFYWFLRMIEKRGYRKADLIVGTMPNLKEHIQKSIKSNFKFTYMPMGFDTENLYFEQKEWQLPNDKFIVGYAGSIGNANQVEDMLKAAEILENNNEIIFAILGDGPLKDILQKKYSHLKNVIWFPKVEKKFVNSFLEQCNVLINNWKNKPIYKYGVSPNKWIDYMYAAKPIIVSYSGYPCIINDAECGEFVEAENPKALSDAILRYSKKDKSELDIIGQKGKDYLLNNLNYNKLSKKYLDSIFE